MESELQDIFTRNDLRLTTPRRRVFAVMRAAEKPQSTTDIARACGEAIDRTSIYRTLDLFTQLGIVHAVPIGWKRRYELAGPFKAHHHHLSCIRCGKLVDISSPELETIMHSIARDSHFTPVGHTFEIRGYCADCQQ